MAVLHQVHRALSFLLNIFVYLYIDAITDAIYRAHDDKADISEYLHSRTTVVCC